GGRGANFEPGEVGDGGGQVNGGSGTDGSERVVRHEIDVMGFCPCGDFHGFGKPADVADVDACEVGDAALYVRKKLPLAGKLFADGERHVDHATERLIGLGRFITDGFLDKVERAARQAL